MERRTRTSERSRKSFTQPRSVKYWSSLDTHNPMANFHLRFVSLSSFSFPPSFPFLTSWYSKTSRSPGRVRSPWRRCRPRAGRWPWRRKRWRNGNILIDGVLITRFMIPDHTFRITTSPHSLPTPDFLDPLTNTISTLYINRLPADMSHLVHPRRYSLHILLLRFCSYALSLIFDPFLFWTHRTTDRFCLCYQLDHVLARNCTRIGVLKIEFAIKYFQGERRDLLYYKLSYRERGEKNIQPNKPSNSFEIV